MARGDGEEEDGKEMDGAEDPGGGVGKEKSSPEALASLSVWSD